MAMKKATPPAPTALVEIVRKRAITTSLKVAEVFGKRHDHVIRDIKDLIEQLEGVPKIGETPTNGVKSRKSKIGETPLTGTNLEKPYFHETTYIHPQNGQEYPMFEMDFNAFTLLAMGFTGKKALQFKLAYITAFNQMAEILNNWKYPAWQEIRGEVKVTFRKLTDVIRDELIPLARSQGSTATDDRFYMSWSMMLCKIGWYNPKSRDKLTLTHLGALNQMQDIAVDTLHGIIERGGANYKEIFQLVKAVLLDYARIARITERFAPKELLAA